MENFIGKRIKVKGENRYRHGILEKIDSCVFNGLDFGEYEALWLKQNRKTLIIKKEEIKEIS